MLKRLIKTKHFWYLIVLPILLTCLFFFGLYKAVKYVDNHDKEIATDNWEIGFQSGLEEGYYNAKDEDWNMLSKKPEVVVLLKKYFPEYTKARTMSAILEAESHHNSNAINYNCYYNGKSQSCKKGDEKKAWSVDCGIAMLNYHGQICPSWTKDPELSMIKAKEMVDKRGFQPWVVYLTGAYKQYLK